MSLVIVKYNAGNVRSVVHAFERLGVTPVVSDDPNTIREADRVVFPGQGEAASAMRYLRERGLDQLIAELTQPFLGVCLGLQLLCKHSEENETDCLGISQLKVKRFPAGNKIPHIGWNSLENARGALFDNLPPDAYVYYVHSFYAELGDETTAITNYGLPFTAALSVRNFHAVQFHPEKSGETGELILKNFLSINN